MKRILSVFSVVAAVLAMMCTASCDEATNYTKGYRDGIYKVWGHTVTPEMEDTSYVVGDVSSYGLKNGDRALLRVKYFIDNVFGPSKAKWEVEKVYEVIEPRAITAGDDIAEGDYQSCILGLANLLYYGPVWAWDGLQNINVAYECDGTEPEFRMVAPQANGDTLCLSLVSRINSGDERYVKLLSFDLNSAYPLLGSEERNAISRYDSIYTKIKLRWYDPDEEAPVDAGIIGGKLKNPFKD